MLRRSGLLMQMQSVTRIEIAEPSHDWPLWNIKPSVADLLTTVPAPGEFEG
jgi:hypothetical protein